MTITAFLSAVLALLLAPGPTNTLMGVAGAQHGVGRVARLLPAEMAGYLTTILPLAYLGAGVPVHWPAAAVVLKAAATAWVMILAVKLWGLRGSEAVSDVTARKVYLTTMLNPKALIFAFVLLPAPDEVSFVPRLGLFCLMVAGVALVWGIAGMLTQLGNGGGERVQLVRRVASVWLALVSVTLAVGVIGR